jgi:hypothetical protein
MRMASAYDTPTLLNRVMLHDRLYHPMDPCAPEYSFRPQAGGGRWEDQDSHDDLDLGPVWIRAHEEILVI